MFENLTELVRASAKGEAAGNQCPGRGSGKNIEGLSKRAIGITCWKSGVAKTL